MNNIFTIALEEASSGKELMLTLILSKKGSAPRSAGSMMLLDPNGILCGSIGGGAAEFSAVSTAKTLLFQKQSRVISYDMTPSGAAELGMACGGEILTLFWYLPPDAQTLSLLTAAQTLAVRDENGWLTLSISRKGEVNASIFADNDRRMTVLAGTLPLPAHHPETAEMEQTEEEILFTAKLHTAGKVYLFGGGHLTKALLPILCAVDFVPVVIDDRPEFSSPQNLPLAAQTFTAAPQEFFAQNTIRPCDYIVIATRGHLLDFDALRGALETSAGYIGLIGSQKKLAFTWERLSQYGVAPEQWDRVYKPIGLPIGAQTPQEIAVSIAAELIAVRAKKREKR